MLICEELHWYWTIQRAIYSWHRGRYWSRAYATL